MYTRGKSRALAMAVAMSVPTIVAASMKEVRKKDPEPEPQIRIHVRKSVGARYCGCSNGWRSARRISLQHWRRGVRTLVFPQGTYNQHWFIGFIGYAFSYQLENVRPDSWATIDAHLKLQFEFPDETVKKSMFDAFRYVCSLTKDQRKELYENGVL